MKIIGIDKEVFRSLIPAPIDEKNICSDALLDAIYDDWTYTESGHQSVGFVDNIATMITYGDAMVVYFLHPYPVTNRKHIVSLWQQTIVNRLTGVSLPPGENDIYILDKEYDLVYGIYCDEKSIAIVIKYNQKK